MRKLLRGTDGWSSHLGNEVVEFIRLGVPELWERPSRDVINLQNGLLRLEDHALLPHSPDHLSTVQLPVAYDPEATCPDTEQFVASVFPPNAQNLAWEIAAWLISPDLSIQKALLLIGEGGNGKSRQLAQWRSFLGHKNTIGTSLHKLEENRFSAARLLGKLASSPTSPPGIWREQAFSRPSSTAVPTPSRENTSSEHNSISSPSAALYSPPITLQDRRTRPRRFSTAGLSSRSMHVSEGVRPRDQPPRP